MDVTTVSPRLWMVPFGPPAFDALRAAIAEGQGDDPLAPVTVVVARAPVGLATRRRLAAAGGVANVRFVTLARLADHLGEPVVAADGREPLSDAVHIAAVRAVLADDAGPLFGPVRLHPATERAIVSATTDLRSAPGAVRRRLAATSARAGEVVRLCEAVEARLARWYDVHDLTVAAVAGLSADESMRRRARELGAVVVFLPDALDSDERALLLALARVVDLTLVLGATGDPTTDAGPVELASALGAATPAGADPVAAVDLSVSGIVNAPTADTEVLIAVRGVAERHRRGTPLERMALVHSGAEPYPRLLAESLDAAGIAYHGSGLRPLSATLAGRTLVGALALAERGWRRDDVMAWIAGAPIRHRRRRVNATVWDRVSRRAGISSGLDQWETHLATFVGDCEADLARPTNDEDDERLGWHRERVTAERDDVLALGVFVAELAERLEPSDPPATWSGWAAWAAGLLRDYLGGPAARGSWSPSEIEAAHDVDLAVARLGALDRLDPHPDLATFRRGLATELEAKAPQTSRFGRGVLVGRVADIVGLELDTVFVVGMIEGAFPTRARDDPLLPDAARLAAGPDLALRATRPVDAQRAWHAGLAGATERVLSFPRGDQRRGRELRPSRWLLDALPELVGRPGPLFSRDLAELGATDRYRVVPSHTAAVAGPGEAMSVADYDRRSTLEWAQRTGGLDGHFLRDVDSVLDLGLRARAERRSHAFTRFDGRVGPSDAILATGDRVVSPTSLENYARCPRRYLLSRVLHVAAVDRPEEVLRISALDKGSLVHEILERFIGGQVALPPAERIAADRAWSASDRADLDAIADSVFADYERQGLTGKALLWDLDRAAIRRDLHTFLEEDSARRAEQGTVPERVELAFDEHTTPVTVDLADGTTIAFRGQVDRIDRAAGGALTVSDYKTGRPMDQGELDDDPVVAGTRLQLPIYGLAARQAAADGGPASTGVEPPVRAEYWFVTEAGGFEPVGYDLDEARLDRFREVLGVIVEGIGSGRFPARPGDEGYWGHDNCRHCEFDALCPRDRGSEWDRMRRAPDLAPYVELAGDTDGPGETAGDTTGDARGTTT